jgi:RNA polymerase sigma factor (sigma-70 family)
MKDREVERGDGADRSVYREMRPDRAVEVHGARAPDTVAELYERHLSRAVGLGRVLTGDHATAEDIAHEAFIRSASRLGALRDPARFETYLLRSVVNLARSRARRLRLEAAFIQRHRPAEAAFRVDTETRTVIRQALLRLPVRQRAAITLRYFADLSEAEVASVLRCSPKAVNDLVQRARLQLRRDLGEEEDR